MRKAILIKINKERYSRNGGRYNRTFWKDIKNNESSDLVIEAIAFGMDDATVTYIPTLTLVKNPTAGTIVSGASNIDMNQNRNFSSPNTLTADAYKGASGNTFTDGSDIAQFYMSDNGRLFATIGFELAKGNSVGIQFNPYLSTGSVDVYAAIICHVKDDKLDL